MPEPWLDFPGARFAAELIRRGEIQKTGEVKAPVTVYLVTNRTAEQAIPGRLPATNRGRWIRDTVFQQDQCRMRAAVLPPLLAALSNLAIWAFRLLRVRNLARFTDPIHSRTGSPMAFV